MNDHHRQHSAPVYLLDGSRRPFLRAMGEPGPFSAGDLAVQSDRTLLMRQPFAPTRRRLHASTGVNGGQKHTCPPCF